MEGEEYQASAAIFLEKVQVTESASKELEIVTRGQADNELWMAERKTRLTASHFGEICKRRPTTPSARLVESLLYP